MTIWYCLQYLETQTPFTGSNHSTQLKHLPLKSLVIQLSLTQVPLINLWSDPHLRHYPLIGLNYKEECDNNVKDERKCSLKINASETPSE